MIARERADRLLQWLVGAKGGERVIRFEESGQWFRCSVPDDSLWGTVVDLLLFDVYERSGLRLVDHKGTVVDAGAHVGIFSLKASVHAKRVIALEPHPNNFRALQSNLAVNNVSNVTCVRGALGTGASERFLFEGRSSIAASLDASDGRSHPVDIVSLEELVSEAGAVDLLKLNIEGSEFEVIEDTSQDTLRKIQAIAGELHLRGRASLEKAVVTKLESAGFQVAVLPPFFYLWKDPLSRLLRNWHRVEDLRRLKLSVLALFTAAAAVEPFLDVRERMNVEGLKFLYARRR